MMKMYVAAIASLGVLVGGQSLDPQTPFRYRQYTLQSSVAAVVKISGARQEDTRTLHVRPARIQQLDWRTPYSRAGVETDPVRQVMFRFVDDQLYQVVVTYDRDRMNGLTDDDVIESIASTYGTPLLRYAPITRDAPLIDEDGANGTIVARWEDAASVLTLSRGEYSPEFRLVLTSTTLNQRAKASIKEAVRLDTQEAPQREIDQRQKSVDDARAASQKARAANKAAFKP